MLEILEDLHPFSLGRRTIDIGFVQSNGILLQSKHVVSKDDNLVIPPFMKLDQKLASSEFVGIHGVQQDPFLGFDCHILPVKLRRHWAPNLSTLDFGDVATVL